MNKQSVLIILIIGVLAVAGIFFIRGVGPSGESETSQSNNQKKPPRVRAIAATKAAISSGLELTGSVEPYRVARLASPAEGPVADIRVREADRVKAGDSLLFIGRKKGADALITSLREELKKEEDNLRRTRQLVEGEALPGEQLDQAGSAFEKVHAQLVQAEETARDYAIYAPWEGVVSRVNVIDDAVIVPLEALVTTPKGQVVFVVEDGRAVARAVKTGIEADNRIQLVSGIQPGDKVIIAGNEKLKSGVDVSLAVDKKSGTGKNKAMAEQPAPQNNKAEGDGQ
ncbi:MAG: efflux RND transporter periplasmic adaptor subunit [Thermodesulfobacteriota bacterium]